MKQQLQTLALILTTLTVTSLAQANPQITPTEQDLTVIQREITKDLFNKPSCFKGTAREFANGSSEESSVKQVSWKVLDRTHEANDYPCSFQNDQNQTVGYDEATQALCLTSQARLYKINIEKPDSPHQTQAEKAFEVIFLTEEMALFKVAATGEILEKTKKLITKDSFLSCAPL